MSNPNEMTWLEMIDDDFFWSTWNQAIGIGYARSNYAFGYGSANGQDSGTIRPDRGLNAVYSFFDTGLAGILISTYYFDDLIKNIYRFVGDSNYQFVEGFIFT